MMKRLALLTLPIIGLSLGGCMYERHENLPPGQYEHSTSSVDARGTARTDNTSTRVYYDQYGNKKYTTDKTTTTDPKGLMNKSTTESHRTVE